MAERDAMLSINNDGKEAVTLMRRILLDNYPQEPRPFELDKLKMALHKQEIDQAFEDYYGNANSM